MHNVQNPRRLSNTHIVTTPRMGRLSPHRDATTMPTTLRATTRVASTTTTTGRGYGRVTGKRAHTTLIVRRSTGGETTAATEASTKEEDGKPAPPEMKSEVRAIDYVSTRFVRLRRDCA